MPKQTTAAGLACSLLAIVRRSVQRTRTTALIVRQDVQTVEQALKQANECGNETWRLWHYRAEKGVLTLCGYRPLFDVTGYLQFYSPSYVRLNQFLENVYFTLGKEGDADMPAGHLVPDDSCVVLIQASESTYCIVCKGAVFAREMS